MDIIFINSHPIQYFTPLYKYLNENGVKAKAWYCSDASIRGATDKEFMTDVKWDIPLLEGYEYRFFKNYSRKHSPLNGFFGLINPGMIWHLFRVPKSIIIIHGWHYFTHLLILLLGRLKGHTICLRYEMPYNQEVQKKGWKQSIKYFFFRNFIFPRIDYFLYIGTQNRLFYKKFGLPDNRLIFCPYSVDNIRFKKEKLLSDVPVIKEMLGIPIDNKIILFSGKYIEKKRPIDLIRAFMKLNQPNCWLIMVGEGVMRKEMEQLINEHNLKQVILTGFINQSSISKYYAISDVFVMCSTIGETWGLAVNEVMNFNVPVIVSDITGCATDLVQNERNGFTFNCGNINELTQKLNETLYKKSLTDASASQEILECFSYTTIRNNLELLKK